jgi:hypothetical protein
MLRRSAGECGQGLKLPKGTLSRWCSEHGHVCWWREDPKEWAKATILLEALKRKGRLDITDDIEPNPEQVQVEEARHFLVERGYELEEGT